MQFIVSNLVPKEKPVKLSDVLSGHLVRLHTDASGNRITDSGGLALRVSMNGNSTDFPIMWITDRSGRNLSTPAISYPNSATTRWIDLGPAKITVEVQHD